MSLGRKGALCGALAMLGVLVTCAPANGAASFSLEGSPSTLFFPGLQTLTYTVRVTTGASEERFSIGATPPNFNNGRFGEGAIMDPTSTSPTLTGPGTLGGGSGAIPRLASAAAVAACTSLGGNHGSYPGTFQRDVSIPAFSSSALSFQFIFGAYAPWPWDSLAPTFLIKASHAGGSTLPADIQLKAPEPVLIGQTGVRINFETRPASSPGPAGLGQLSTIKRGREIKIRGTTEPPLSRQILRLLVQGQGDSKLHTLAKVRTNKRGGFVYKDWKPKKLGFYEVGVTYQSQRPTLVSDFACSRYFELVK